MKGLFVPRSWYAGPSVDAVEDWMKKYHEVDFAQTYDSGRSALYCALKALGVGEGDQVLVQAYTCLVVVNAIVWTGAEPVFVDVGDDLNMDVSDARQKYTSKVKAMIIQHTFGSLADINGLLAFVVYMILDIKYDKNEAKTTEQTKADPFKLSDVGDLLTNKAYLYIALICVTFYSAVFPFMAFAPDFFYHKFGMTYEKSGQIASLLPLGTLLFTPLFGFLIDRKGRAATAMIFGSLTLLVVHLVFTFTGFPPYVPMILLGVAFSLVPAAMWPSMVKLVEEKEIGTAYGLMYSIQNLGL